MFANLTPMLWLHFVAVTLALGLGGRQLAAPKGTCGHALAGRAYVAAMLIGNLSALTSYRLGINIFHGFALLSLFSLGTGLKALRDWRRGGGEAALRGHKIQMSYSYLGLVMAGVSQFAVNPRFGLAAVLPSLAFWTLFAAINILLYAAGSWLIFARLAPARETADSGTARHRR